MKKMIGLSTLCMFLVGLCAFAEDIPSPPIPFGSYTDKDLSGYLGKTFQKGTDTYMLVKNNGSATLARYIAVQWTDRQNFKVGKTTQYCKDVLGIVDPNIPSGSSAGVDAYLYVQIAGRAYATYNKSSSDATDGVVLFANDASGRLSEVGDVYTMADVTTTAGNALSAYSAITTTAGNALTSYGVITTTAGDAITGGSGTTTDLAAVITQLNLLRTLAANLKADSTAISNTVVQVNLLRTLASTLKADSTAIGTTVTQVNLLRTLAADTKSAVHTLYTGVANDVPSSAVGVVDFGTDVTAATATGSTVPIILMPPKAATNVR